MLTAEQLTLAIYGKPENGYNIPSNLKLQRFVSPASSSFAATHIASVNEGENSFTVMTGNTALMKAVVSVELGRAVFEDADEEVYGAVISDLVGKVRYFPTSELSSEQIADFFGGTQPPELILVVLSRTLVRSSNIGMASKIIPIHTVQAECQLDHEERCNALKDSIPVSPNDQASLHKVSIELTTPSEQPDVQASESMQRSKLKNSVSSHAQQNIPNVELPRVHQSIDDTPTQIVPVKLSQPIDPVSCIKFLNYVGKLKQVLRTGWVLRGVASPESVCDHSHRMATMCMLIDDPSIDLKRAALMALIHDLAESITGDIAPGQGVGDAEKERLEHVAMETIAQQTLGDQMLQGLGVSMKELWKEYEDRKSKESLLVKDLDRLEMVIQALEYEEHQNKNLDEFFGSVRGKIKHPQVISWYKEVERRHEILLSSRQGLEEVHTDAT